MNESLLTNEELHRWICLNEEPAGGGRRFLPGQVSSCRAFWHHLKSFSERNSLIEDNFKENSKSNFHSAFWELYLPYAFESAGISLKRGKEEGQPDFYFEKGGQKFWMEAVVCGEPQEECNRVPPPGNDFQSGLNSSYENQSMQRLASAVSSKIRKFQGYRDKKVVTNGNPCVIALNGWRALNGHPDAVANEPPMIVRMLFGLGDLWLSHQGQNVSQYYEHAEKTKPLRSGGNGAPIAHFADPQNAEIAGVLYSAANIFETRQDILGHDFIFIPNPHAPDVSATFEPIRELQKTSNKALRETAI